MAVAEQEKAAKARDAALKGALSQIEREFGKGSVMRMGDEGAQVRVNAIPTGALSLDLALGIGGVPRGRIVEVFGPESSGKTTLIYHVLAEAQKLGGVCAFIDAEHAMDPLYAREIGVDIDELLVSQPDYGEQALEIADMLVRSGAVDVVAIDSVAALTPRAELEGQMGDQTVGLQARMMSQAMRKLAGNLNRTQTLCILTNQIREKIGVMFGSPDTQPGARPEVLRLPAPRHQTHRDTQGRHRSGGQPRAGQGRQEQGGRSLPPSRVRHRVRQRHLHLRLPDRPRPGAQHRV
jgi:recombination protein RecA